MIIEGRGVTLRWKSVAKRLNLISTAYSADKVVFYVCVCSSLNQDLWPTNKNIVLHLFFTSLHWFFIQFLSRVVFGKLINETILSAFPFFSSFYWYITKFNRNFKSKTTQTVESFGNWIASRPVVSNFCQAMEQFNLRQYFHGPYCPKLKWVSDF